MIRPRGERMALWDRFYLGVFDLMGKGTDEMTESGFSATEEDLQGNNQFMELFEESLKSI